jgi:predicted dinucleotide-binding enzyme
MGKANIGVIGSGQVAQVLAAGFIYHGYPVTVGSRDTTKLNDWHGKHPDAKLGSYEDACQFGDIIVLAVKGIIAEVLVKSLAFLLKNKTILDTTNPIAEAPPENGVLKYFTTLDDSLMERLQRAAPDANFVKAFNCIGNALMVNPKLPGGKPTMFICGNHEESKKEASEILETFGWEVADLGKAEAARAIEPLCMLWCIPGFLNNQWTHAFKLLKA